jgi:hypothetical protein
MIRFVARAGLVAALFAAALPAAGADKDKPTKVEIAKRMKAATGFVEVLGRANGTAFCVHPSGLFVTTEGAVRGADATGVTVTLNAGQQNEKMHKATVVRVDKTAELALLRVEGLSNQPALPLGTADGLTELADVFGCGFSPGRAAPGTDNKGYLILSVNAGTVSSVRHKGNQPLTVAVDLGTIYNCYGGPLLDDTGKVVGVLVSFIGGKPGGNDVIPVNRVLAFLNEPDVTFAPPEVLASALDKPHEFKARVAALAPGGAEPRVKLLLQSGTEKAREFPMTKANNEWVASAKPLAGPAAPVVELTVRIGGSSVTGTADDAELTVGGTKVKLSAVRKLVLGAKPVATLADGKTLEGPVAGLRAVELRIGDQKVKLDLAKAGEIGARATDELPAVTATVVVVGADDKELARASAPVPIRRAAGPGTPGGPDASAAKVTKQLPDTFSDAVVAGGGRYLVFQMPKLKKLAVFDIAEAKVVNYIPLAEDKATFAAGLDCVIVGLPSAGRLERWSLATFEREKNVSVAGEIRGLLMGHAATWAVAVDGVFYDPVTLKPIPFKYDGTPAYKGLRAWIQAEQPLFPSADGTVYGNWNPNLSPSDCGVRVIEGGEMRRHMNANLFHTIPGPDGRWVYTSKGVVTREMKYAHADDEKYGYCLPATSGDYFIGLTSASERLTGGSFTVYHRGVKGPIGRIEQADHGLKFEGWGRERYGPWRRVFFVPEAKVIAVLPESNDRVVLHKFDIDVALEKSGLDYLFVASTPPRAAKPGAPLTYPLATKSKHGGVTYKVDSGPKGMTVSATGVVTWAVPADATGEQTVVLSVKDKAGNEAFHSFALKITK